MKISTLHFSSLLGCVVVAAAATAEPAYAPSSGAGSSARSPDASSRTSAHARQRDRLRRAGWLRQETTRRLRAEAGSDGAANLRAVDDLLELYVLLRLDETLTDAGRERLVGKVRSRLVRVQDRLDEGSLEAAARPTERSAAPLRVTDAVRSAPPARTQLAVFLDRRTAIAAVELAPHVLAQQGVAGPAGTAAAGAVAAQSFPPDYGQELADLIQTVIAPSTWERNGGPGSIYYYGPRQVLVIRQTGQVHDDVGDVIEQMRQAGN